MPLLLPLLNLARKYWRESAIGALVLAVALVGSGWARDRRELAKTRLVYENPQVRVVTREVRVSGPVRVVERVVERPGGEIERTREETRGEVVETTGTEKESQPVPLSVAMAPPRTDRWLVGVQAGREKRYTALAGYSFRNRVDLMGGAGTDGLALQVVCRF